MKIIAKRWMKIVLFLLPLLVVSSPILLSGEQLGSGDVARSQQMNRESVLYGPISEENYRYFKAESARIVKPSVLVMGGSRSLQIRSFFFDKDINFYNAGYVSKTPVDIQYFLTFQNLQNLDVLIISLGEQIFNDNSGEVPYPVHYSFSEDTNSEGFNFAFQKDYMINNFMSGKTVLNTNLLNLNIIGQNAKINLNGMLCDGSYYYGERFKNADAGQTGEERSADALKRIEKGTGYFQYGDKINTSTVNSLKQLLQYCKEHGVFVIAYAPPYAPIVREAMQEKGDLYQFQDEMLQIVPEIFKDYGYEFYDYTDMTFLGCTDDFYLDGFHGSDVVFLRMFIDMIERGSRLSEYCSIEALRAYDESRFSDIRLLNTWEQYNEMHLLRD